MLQKRKFQSVFVVFLICLLAGFLPDVKAQNISMETWQKIVKTKYERYSIPDMDRLIFIATERYFDAIPGSEDEKFYLKMIVNFVINKHLRLKKAEWELGIGKIESKLKLIEKYKIKSRKINEVLSKKPE